VLVVGRCVAVSVVCWWLVCMLVVGVGVLVDVLQ